MTALSKRQQLILFAIVKHYIKTAQPVGSKWLAESYPWGCSPATIRNDMGLLEDYHYIYQPFTSAGRVPLEPGYRFFVEEQMHQLPTSTQQNELLNEILDKQTYESWEVLLQELCIKLAHKLKSNVVIATVDNQIYSAGLQFLLQNPEFRETEHILPLIRIIEDNRQMFSFLKNLEFQSQQRVVLMIGKEHFWGNFAPYTTVAGYFSNPSQKGWITVFGPTRMHYKRNISTINQLASELSALETLYIEE